MELNITLNYFVGVNLQNELSKLRDACENGKIDYLILGNEIIGKFVLESIDEDAEQFGGNGQTLISNIKLHFKEYK